MAVFFFIFCVQVVIAGVVIFILKRLLDKELVEAALEKLQGLSAGDIAGEIVLRVNRPDFKVQGRFEDLVRRRFPAAQLIVQEDAGLKGGVVLIVAGQTLDFSITSRLKGFWS